jgi:Xaa-Pro aminopeptidase
MERTGTATTLPGLAPHDHAGRLRAVVSALPGAGPDGGGVDVAVITKLVNLRYLIGFSGSNGLLVLHAAGATLVTDGRYRDQAAAQLGAAGLADGPAAVAIRVENIDADGVVAELIAGHQRVGLEASAIPWAVQRRYAERFTGHELVPTTNLVEEHRIRKDAGEVARIEAAAAIADQALHDCLPRLHDGVTEHEFALELEVAMRRLGAEGPAFDTIIASGPNAALPHARPSGRRIERGDLVVVDFGATVAGYRSDMTRTVCVGPATVEQRRLYDVVREAQATARDGVRAGVATKEIDAIARRVIGEAGWGEQFTHGTGHGIGLEVHEAPMLSRTTPGELSADVVCTVEPGVYLPGVGGVRVEDTVVVGADGCRSLTRFPKELEV